MILISHGHYDHIGSISRIVAMAPKADIITTQDTKQLISMQLLDFGRISVRKESERIRNERYRLAQALMDRIQVRPVMKTFDVRGCKITFYPAGHMLGAVQIHIQTNKHRILYSGDFSVHTLHEVNTIRLPKNGQQDILLLNAPNAYQKPGVWEEIEDARVQSKYMNKTCDDLHITKLEQMIHNCIQNRQNVYLISRSIPRHLDLFYFLKNTFPNIPVILEEKSQEIAGHLADMGYCVIGENFHLDNNKYDGPHIVVGQESSRKGCTSIVFDMYSLHASPEETLQYVKETGVKQVYLLHAKPVYWKEMFGSNDQQITVTQAVNGSKYILS